ncbi:MAG: heme A synthase, partial [Pseudoclavibacter sp.]|nr:heme A synthase [Pseudoclavibacter sp.]
SAADRGLRPVRRAAIGLLLLLLVQTAVGIWQSRTGLPVELVAVHMGLGTVSVCLATVACVLLFRAAPRSAAEA